MKKTLLLIIAALLLASNAFAGKYYVMTFLDAGGKSGILTIEYAEQEWVSKIKNYIKDTEGRAITAKYVFREDKPHFLKGIETATQMKLVTEEVTEKGIEARVTLTINRITGEGTLDVKLHGKEFESKPEASKKWARENLRNMKVIVERSQMRL